MAGMIKDMFQRFMVRQNGFFEGLSEEAKQKLEKVGNKYAELSITGPEGGTFYFQFMGQHLIMLDGPPDIPYEQVDKLLLDGDYINYPGGDEVLFDVIDKSLSPKAAVARDYFQVLTDKIIYDREEFAQAFERFLDEMRIVLGKGKKVDDEDDAS